MSQDGGVDPVSFSYHLGAVTVTDAAGDDWHFDYDQNGLLEKFVDPLGNTWFATYDGNFNLTSLTGATGLTTDVTSTMPTGNLISFTDPLGQTTSFTYAGAGQPSDQFTDAQGNTTRYQLRLQRQPDIGPGPR